MSDRTASTAAVQMHDFADVRKKSSKKGVNRSFCPFLERQLLTQRWVNKGLETNLET